MTLSDDNISTADDPGTEVAHRILKKAARGRLPKRHGVKAKRPKGSVLARKQELAHRKQELRLALRKQRLKATRAAAQAVEANRTQPKRTSNQGAALDPPAGTAFVPTNRWRGYVEAIDGKQAVIRLSTAAAHDEHELRVPVDEIVVLGGEPLEAAMPIMLTQGRETRSGRPRRTITLEARPLPAWTGEEVTEIEHEARRRSRLLREDA